MTKATTRVAAVAPQDLLDAKLMTQPCCHMLQLPTVATLERYFMIKTHEDMRTIDTFAKIKPRGYGTKERSIHTETSATNNTRHRQGKTHTDWREQSHKIASTSTQQSKDKTPNQSQVQREQEPAKRNPNRTDSSTHPRTQLAQTKAQQMHPPTVQRRLREQESAGRDKTEPSCVSTCACATLSEQSALEHCRQIERTQAATPADGPDLSQNGHGVWWLWYRRCVAHACLSMRAHYAAN